MLLTFIENKYVCVILKFNESVYVLGSFGTSPRTMDKARGAEKHVFSNLGFQVVRTCNIRGAPAVGKVLTPPRLVTY